MILEIAPLRYIKEGWGRASKNLRHLDLSDLRQSLDIKTSQPSF